MITGIANSKHLIKLLKETTKEVIHKKFPDHYRFKSIDFKRLSEDFVKIPTENKIIITTEKDSVRFDGVADDFFKNLPIYKIPVKVDFLNDDAKEFNKIIEHYVFSNKRKKLV